MARLSPFLSPRNQQPMPLDVCSADLVNGYRAFYRASYSPALRLASADCVLPLKVAAIAVQETRKRHAEIAPDQLRVLLKEGITAALQQLTQDILDGIAPGTLLVQEEALTSAIDHFAQLCLEAVLHERSEAALASLENCCELLYRLKDDQENLRLRRQGIRSQLRPQTRTSINTMYACQSEPIAWEKLSFF